MPRLELARGARIPGACLTEHDLRLIHTGLLSVGLSNLFWKGSEISANPDDRVLILAMGLFCLAIPFQGLYILLSRMIRSTTRLRS